MVLKVLFALCVALEFVFVPLFLKYSWPDKCWKSFGYKMVCSALFFFFFNVTATTGIYTASDTLSLDAVLPIFY